MADSSSLYYEPYFCLGTLLATPEAIRTTRQGPYGGDPVQRLDELHTLIDSYRSEVQCLIDWRAGGEGKPLAPWLYKPLSLSVVGFLDEVSLVLVDTPDAYFRYFSQDGISPTQVNLAVVPRLDALGIPTRELATSQPTEEISPPLSKLRPDGQKLDYRKWIDSFDSCSTKARDDLHNYDAPFVRLQDLFGEKWTHLRDESRAGYSPNDRNPLEYDTPLVAFARLRMGSLAALAGNQFRCAFHRTIARAITRTQLWLLDQLHDQAESEIPMGAMGLDSADTIGHLTVAVMDPSASKRPACSSDRAI